MQVGNATVSIGAGTAILDLPDIEFVQIANGALTAATGKIENSSDFLDEYGGGINGSVSWPKNGVGNGPGSFSLNGFYATIDDNDTATCTQTATSSCVIYNTVDLPGGFSSAQAGPGNSFISTTDREVGHWGISIEKKQQLSGGGTQNGPASGSTARYVALGADLRGLDQDLDLQISNTGTALQFRYDEKLETRYYGMYAAWGGDYSLFPRLTSSLGLQSSFMLRGGLYYADTDFSGVTSTSSPSLNGSLNLSDNEVAFIGGLALQTRKQIGTRATISLLSEYEYYSYVPEVTYNTFDSSTAIGRSGSATSLGSDDAFSARTSLRLTIKLGPDRLFEEPR